MNHTPIVNSLPALPATTCPDLAQLLQTAVEQAFNAVVITNAGLHDGGPCITYCNSAFCRMTGYALTELLGRSPRLLQGPKTDPQVLQRLRECLQQGRFFQGSTVNYRKDGSSYLVEWNISPVRDAQGQVQAYVSVQQDITARVRAEQRQALLARALNATQDAVLIADEQAQILFVNQAFEDLTGYRSDEVQGRTPKFLQSGEHTPAFYAQLREALERGESYQTTFANRRKDGSLYHAAQTITPLKDKAGATQHYVSVTKDVTELVTRTQELREQAHHDALTGLLNRRAGEQQLQRCQRAAQLECQDYALILADIDNFKSINDRFGHDEGDRVLQRCAALLSRTVRSGDALIRWGGEEFLIVLPGCKLAAAQELAERIRRTMACEQDAVVGTITLSLGVGAWQPGECSSTLLRRTDQALYRAKTSGRNQVAVAP
ncbi:MAG: sensor domain-containing diguanylate cyclase [Comamonas sp.]|nr:sensor domain-containing diguanylate cyclase [Comamonas sp.]